MDDRDFASDSDPEYETPPANHGSIDEEDDGLAYPQAGNVNNDTNVQKTSDLVGDDSKENNMKSDNGAAGQSIDEYDDDDDDGGDDDEFQRNNQSAVYGDDGDTRRGSFDFSDEPMQPMLIGGAKKDDNYRVLALFIRIVSVVFILFSVLFLGTSVAKLFDAIQLQSTFSIIVNGVVLGINMFVVAVYIVGSCFGFQSTFESTNMKDRLFKARAYRAILIFYVCMSVLLDLTSSATVLQYAYHWWAYLLGVLITVFVALFCCLPCLYCAHSNVVALEQLEMEEKGLHDASSSHRLSASDMI